MGRTHFDDDWKIWIWHNVSRGCDKDDIFQILLDHGFRYDLIRSELNHELGSPVDLSGPPFMSTEQCDRAAALGLLYLPHAKRHPSPLIELYTVDNFLNESECRALIELAKTGLVPSTHTNENEPDDEYRTSSTCHIGGLEDPLVRDVDRRICAILGINPSFSESLQAHYYEPSQQFKAHTDAFSPNTPEFEQYGAEQGQRTWTVMIYLNDVARGGGTEFPHLETTLSPQQGQAVVWKNVDLDGQPNDYTLHRGLPVLEGYKVILTKWFRERPAGIMHTKESREYIKGFSNTGFKKTTIPESVIRAIRRYHDEHGDRLVEEHVSGGYLQNQGGHPTYLIELPQQMRADILEDLRPVCEQWCGTELEPVVVYGIRRYVRGTWLRRHADTKWSHIISAILNIDQNVDEPWPLLIEDHCYRWHEVLLDPGDMLLYEGARLQHGRPTPLAGDYYSNVFVHYRPKGFNIDYVPGT